MKKDLPIPKPSGKPETRPNLPPIPSMGKIKDSDKDWLKIIIIVVVFIILLFVYHYLKGEGYLNF